MNSIVYILQTSYNTFVVFLKVLSHFIMKIKNFMKYFKGGVRGTHEIFQNFHEIFKYLQSIFIMYRIGLKLY